MSKIMLQHPESQKERYAVTGFSFTSFFFGFIPLLFRKNLKWTGIYLAMLVVFIIVLIILGVLMNLSEKSIDSLSNALGMGIGIGWASIINRLHLRDLLAQGYRITDFGDSDAAAVSKFAGMDVTGAESTASVFE